MTARGVYIETKIIFETAISMWTRLGRVKMQRWIVMFCERAFVCAHPKTFNTDVAFQLAP